MGRSTRTEMSARCLWRHSGKESDRSILSFWLLIQDVCLGEARSSGVVCGPAAR